MRISGTLLRFFIYLSMFLSSVAARANPVTYIDYVAHVSVSLGSSVYNCTTLSSPDCAFVSFTAVGDTSNVYPFSVPGASGFKNSIQSATVDVFLNSGQSFSTVLVPGQIFVSVDQTNGGAGFGSSYGPTYPIATYGGNADYANYGLTTDFYVQGFAPFCPGGVSDPLCANGAPLHTMSGDDFVISYPFAPVFSIFSSTVQTIPEPSSIFLLVVCLIGLSLSRTVLKYYVKVRIFFRRVRFGRANKFRLKITKLVIASRE